jgi:hypothetical protein
MMSTRLTICGVLNTALMLASCGGSTPTRPTSAVLPESLESPSFSYRFSTGDSVQSERQEAHHQWAIAQLGVTLPQKIAYNKYLSRAQMGEATGKSSTNGFAEPERFTIHTLWAWDNHEPVHVYTALIGRPSDFFNEGIAVAFQTDPAAGNYASMFNGQQVHAACAEYRRLGLLLPLDQIIESSGFRAVTDSVLSYREAGSFVRYLIDRDGLDRMKAFFRASSVSDSRATIRDRFRTAFDRSLDEAERDWLTSLPR